MPSLPSGEGEEMRVLGSEPDTIWKFPFPITDEFSLTMPKGAIPLSVGVQSNVEPMVWAAVNSKEKAKEKHRFRLCGTGHPIPGLMACRFVGTFQLTGIGLVCHLFDLGPEETK
jgi:hypothetical protein